MAKNFEKLISGGLHGTARKTLLPTAAIARTAQRLPLLCAALLTALQQRPLYSCLFRGGCLATGPYVTLCLVSVSANDSKV
jgi:hypothetical protein